MACFIKSCFNEKDWPIDNIVEFIFVGRSNVGKSSLINALANQKIAVVSKTPGRTQTANLYDFDKFRLIDLPGYGYAKVNKGQRNQLISLIDATISSRRNVFGVIQVCDATVITNEDIEMSKYLQTRFANYFVVLNKADKYALKTYQSNLNKIKEYFKIANNNFIFTSVKAKINTRLLLNKLKNWANI